MLSVYFPLICLMNYIWPNFTVCLLKLVTRNFVATSSIPPLPEPKLQVSKKKMAAASLSVQGLISLCRRVSLRFIL